MTTLTRLRRAGNHIFFLPLLFFTCFAVLTAQEASWLTDATSEAGLDGVTGFRIYVVDADGDDFPDLLLENGLFHRNQLSLYMNRPRPGSSDPHDRIYVDFTEESGINANPDPEIDGRVADVAAMADLDNDGDMDLVTGIYYHRLENYEDLGDRCAVLLNDGAGHFTYRENNGLWELGLINTSGLLFLDYDYDGNLDLYIPTWSQDHSWNLFMQDYLLKGNGDGTFTDVTVPSRIITVKWPMYGANATDWNNDGLQDVLTSPYCRSSGNLWKNNGDGTFTDVASEVGYNSQVLGGDNGQALCQWEGMPADFDNDGDMDVLHVLVHGGNNQGEGRTVLAINQGAEKDYHLEWDLSRIPRETLSQAHFGDQDAAWLDLNLDGRLDIILSSGVYMEEYGYDQMYVELQKPDNTFEDITEELNLKDLEGTHALEVLDFDRDGDDDILIARYRNKVDKADNDQLVLLRNEIGNTSGNNHVAVKLEAPEGVNGDAIGARIMVTAGGVTQIREVQAGRGHFGGQQPHMLNIGLGETDMVDSIVVRWPHASMPNSVVRDIAANRLVRIGGSGLLGVKEKVAAEGGLEIYPNPAQAAFRLRVPEQFRTGAHVEVYNVLGMQVKRLPVAGTESEVSMQGLPAGRYLLRIVRFDGISIAGTAAIVR